jgi:hypothetical protein
MRPHQLAASSFAAEHQQLQAEKRAQAAAVAALAKDRADFERSQREYSDRLADLERLKKVLSAA